jgi:outer membrane assembly lipoprotein YfiO
MSLLAVAATVSAQDRYSLTGSDEWQKQAAVDPASPEGQLELVRRAYAEQRFDRAESLATAWIERNKNHPLTAEALLLRGDAKRANSEEYLALFDYEQLIRAYPSSEVFVNALQRELQIARQYAGGMKRKFWGMRIVDASDEAEELLVRIQERLPGSELAEEAGIALADFYFSRQRMAMAVEMYDIFIRLYPDSKHISAARRRLIYAHLASFKGPQFDPSGLYEAREALRRLRVNQPMEAQEIGADALLAGIDDSDADKMLTTANWYLRTGDVISAEYTMRRVVMRYPRSVATRTALESMPSIITRLSPHLQAQVRAAGVYPPSVFGESESNEGVAAPAESSQ